MSARKIVVYHEPLKNVSPEIITQFHKLNLGYDLGLMHISLKSLLHRIKHNACTSAPYVFYVKDKHGHVKSWALTFLKYDDSCDRARRVIHFYTKKSERNLGYATAIAQTSKEIFPRVVGYSECSTIFRLNKIKGIY